MTMCLMSNVDGFNPANNIRKLIVGDIAPVKYVNWDIPQVIEAMKSVPVHNIKLRNEAEYLLEKGGIADPHVRAFILSNLNFKGGKYEWRCNLHAIDNNLNDLADFPFNEHSPQQYPNPVLLMKGGKSKLVRDSHMPIIHHLFPQVHLTNFENCDHWIHFQDPKRFVKEVLTFLDGKE